MEKAKTFSEMIRYQKLNTYKGLYGKIPIRFDDIYIGIEVEAERISRSLVGNRATGSFKQVDDGSLKVSGKEFVSPPIKLKYLEVELDRLFKSIPTASFSSRTSIHAHMNARDFTAEELLVFIMLYIVFEKPLYDFSGGRWQNNFCIPLRHSGHHVNRLFSSIRNHGLENLFAHGISWSKYLGLNVAPLMGIDGQSSRYGTIEFRQMSGNNDVDKIMNWCNLITCLKFFAKRTPVNQMIDMVRKDYVSYAEAVFGKWTPLLNIDKDCKDIAEGNSYLKLILDRTSLIEGYKETAKGDGSPILDMAFMPTPPRPLAPGISLARDDVHRHPLTPEQRAAMSSWESVTISDSMNTFRAYAARSSRPEMVLRVDGIDHAVPIVNNSQEEES